MTFFGDLQPILIQDGLEARASHPDEPVLLFYLPPILNEIFRGLNNYDPYFGETFFASSWDQGFNHAGALRRIRAPTVLIHTNWSYNDEGILMAAMDDMGAARARALLEDVEFYRVDSGHGFHFEKPRDFAQIVTTFPASAGSFSDYAGYSHLRSRPAAVSRLAVHAVEAMRSLVGTSKRG